MHRLNRNHFTLHPQDHLYLLRTLLKWMLLGSVVGVLAGTASALFLTLLDTATALRLAHPELLALLPGAGFIMGWVYWRFGGAANRGTTLVIAQINTNTERIPLRMAPLVLAGTVITHLFGGSAGREGTAIQMGSSLADGLRRLLRLDLTDDDRQLLLLAGISGGFSSVFGTPIAGFVFGLEVQKVGRIRYEGVIPCLAAALVGDLVTRAWGVGHAHYPVLPPLPLDVLLLGKVALAGALFGLTSLLFVELTHAIKWQARRLTYPPLRLVAGGLLVIGLTLLVGTADYLGLSLPLIHASLDGTGVATFAFLFKLVFTALTLGTGFLGGEVTPLFVIGATLGYTLSGPLGAEPGLLASVGFVAVFAGASNTPLACALMGVELFGGGALSYIALGCFMAYLASGHRGIYMTQVISTPKTRTADAQPGESLEALQARRRETSDSREQS